MSCISEREKEILILEYTTLHKENWDRGHNVWLVNSILITGSLIVTFQPQEHRLLAPLISLFLVFMAFMLNATSDLVTKITYDRMEGIRKILGMNGPTLMYHNEIEPKRWYSIRRNLPYLLYLVIATIYLFTIVRDQPVIPLTAMTVGILAMLTWRKTLKFVKRWTEKSRRGIRFAIPVV